MEFKNNYPCVFIHGLMGFGEEDQADQKFRYWGVMDKDLMKHLEDRGIETFHPSVGPVNSAWDRTCVLWAYLFGGRVDYGKVHAAKYGHARYGREYPGVLKDLGQTEAHKKINLLGHSFGGPSVKEMVALFAYGSEEERAGTPADELSPLFEGGHGNLIHTVTTLSGVNNGTTLASFLGDKGMSFMTYYILGMNALTRTTPVQKFYNFKTQHWGLMPEVEEITGWKFSNPLDYVDVYRAYNKNKTLDSIAHEMQLEVVQELVNPNQLPLPNIYYFAQRADCTKPGRLGGRTPNRDESCMLCYVAGQMTARTQLPRLAKYGVKTDPNWKTCDGFVNVTGQSGPLNAPYEEADYNTDFKPGIWYNMPVERGDHVLWNGWMIPEDRYYGIYDRMIDIYRNLPDGENA